MRYFQTILVLTLLIAALMAATSGLSGVATERERPLDVLDLEELAHGIQRVSPPHYVPKQPGLYTRDDWAAVIDATWGEGMPTAEKLAFFSDFWDTVDSLYACFQNLEETWSDSLRNHYETEIAGGVSKGRFCGIMNHLTLRLKELHTFCINGEVSHTQLDPGVPVMYADGWGLVDHFGAALTPLTDKSLLVYDAVAGHPLDLEPGDLVLGYEGIPWHQLYPALLEAQLPFTTSENTGAPWGSNEITKEHCFLGAAGQNWHLFDSIDIVDHDTGDTLQYPTSLLESVPNVPIRAHEQLQVPGIPPVSMGSPVVWGTIDVDSFQFGYISVLYWQPNTGQDFLTAISDLYGTDGLIIDMRYNMGGWEPDALPGLQILFADTTEVTRWAYRCGDPGDHFSMCPRPWEFDILADDSTYYSRPIALLVGPGCVSAGDVVAYALSLHPMTRIFGRTSSMSPNDNMSLPAPPGWHFHLNTGNAYMYQPFPPPPEEYLTHQVLDVDVEVWLEPDDVALGIDTVIEAATDWFLSWWVTGVEQGAPVAPTAPIVILHPNAPNPFNPVTAIRFELVKPVDVSLKIYDLAGRGVRTYSLQQMPAGLHSQVWDGRDERGALVPSGTYLVKIDTGDWSEQQKVMLVR